MVAGRARPNRSLEAEVIACLAASERALTPAEVRAEIGAELAYTTVMTTLSRLHAKRAVVRTPRGRAFAYQLVGGVDGARASMTAHQMQRLLATDDDRASVLSRFVSGLDDESEKILRELLRQHPVDDPPAPKPRASRRRKT